METVKRIKTTVPDIRRQTGRPRTGSTTTGLRRRLPFGGVDRQSVGHRRVNRGEGRGVTSQPIDLPSGSLPASLRSWSGDFTLQLFRSSTEPAFTLAQTRVLIHRCSGGRDRATSKEPRPQNVYHASVNGTGLVASVRHKIGAVAEANIEPALALAGAHLENVLGTCIPVPLRHGTSPLASEPHCACV